MGSMYWPWWRFRNEREIQVRKMEILGPTLIFFFLAAGVSLSSSSSEAPSASYQQNEILQVKP